VTPLDFVGKRHVLRRHATRGAFTQLTQRQNFFHSRDFAQKFTHRAEVPMKYGFL
jgi:hypothetical protein